MPLPCFIECLEFWHFVITWKVSSARPSWPCFFTDVLYSVSLHQDTRAQLPLQQLVMGPTRHAPYPPTLARPAKPSAPAGSWEIQPCQQQHALMVYGR